MTERNLPFDTREGLLERDLQIVAQVRAALRSGRSLLRSAAAACAAEEHVEDVGDAVAARETAETTGAGRAGISYGTEAIVLLTLLRVAQHLVRFVDLFELVLGRGFVGSDVGVMDPREPAVRTLDIGLGCVTFDAEHRIIIGRHGSSSGFRCSKGGD